MLKEERQQHILATLKEQGKVVAAEISLALDVSEDTIRRDLNELAEAGLLRRVHGGAVARAATEAAYTARSQQQPDAKSAIARAAVSLLRDGQLILLDCGTSATQLARHIPLDLRATIVTINPLALVALAEHPHLELIMLGGALHKETMAIVGVEAAAALSRLRADICFLGVNGLHPEAGITDFSYEEAHLKRIMIENAAEVVALASGDKLGAVAPFVLGPSTALTHLVTTTDVADELLTPYHQQGITILRA
ncbi:MAG: DeoR/GlpR transcriptional regulator [Anaerolineae bacterium]|nr:DeoR/GlpR transcriptional regulator [Anaerolineae bacterium]